MTRYALVIGISQYDSPSFPSLKKAVTDAEEMAQLLERSGAFQEVVRFPCKWVNEKSRYEIISQKVLAADLYQTLKTFLLEKAARKDALVYYAGHGFQITTLSGEKQGFLAASNSAKKDMETLIRLEDLNKLVSDSDLSSLVILLDCCHAGALLETFSKDLVQSTLKSFNRQPDYCLITACRAEEKAYEDQEHGLFTKALLQGLQPEQAADDGNIYAGILTVFICIQLKGSGQEPVHLLSGRPIPILNYSTQRKPQKSKSFPHIPLPENYVERLDALKAVKEKLLGRNGQTLVVTAIAGLGGLGKSVLAAALVRDPEVNARFEDGILWVTLGQKPDLQKLLGDWIRELDRSREAFSANTKESATQYLQTLLAEKQMLLVVDDVWNADHAKWFQVGGEGCRVLVTTREARIAQADYYSLDLMSEDEALELIKGKLGKDWKDADQIEAKAFAQVLGYLPLALDLAINLIKDGSTWAELRAEFKAEFSRVFKLLQSSERWEDLDEQEQRKHSLEVCFNLSLKRLNQEQLEQFAWLGILPEDVNLTLEVASVLWNLSSNVQVKQRLSLLRHRSFLTDGVTTLEDEPTYRIHDLMHDMARSLIEEGKLNSLGSRDKNCSCLSLAHQQFLERYREKTEEKSWYNLPNDGYIHRQLTWHLEQAGWIDEIHTLLGSSDRLGHNAWFETCDRLGQPAIFVEDVARAWAIAEQQYEQDKTRSIVLQYRYALITATLNSLLENLPIDMIKEFVKGKFWTIEQAWAYVEQMQDEHKIAEWIKGLCCYFSKPLFKKALTKISAIQDEYHRAEALSALAQIDRAYFAEALDATRAIQNESNRAEVLSALAQIDRAYFTEALDAARAIQDKKNRAEALSALAQIDRAYFTEALDAARAIQDEKNRALVLSSLAQIDNAYFTEALDAAQASQDQFIWALVLSSLAQIDRAYFAEALDATRALQDESFRAWVLSSLAQIDSACFTEALDAARAIQDESRRALRAKVLSSLAQIDSACFTEALDAARAIQDESIRAKVLSSLAQIDRAYFAEALDAVRAIQSESIRAEVLSSLAQIDSADFSVLLDAAHTIQDKFLRAWVLRSLAQIDSADFSVLLNAARAIQDKYSRAEVLRFLAQIDSAYFGEALDAARTIQSEPLRALVLRSLAQIDSADFSVLLDTARAIQSESLRALVLRSLAQIDGADFSVLLDAARTIQDKYSRAEVLSSLAQIDRAYFAEALDAARTIQDESSRAEVLSSLAQIDRAYFAEALDAARTIQDESSRAEVLNGLSKFVPEQLLSQVKNEIFKINSKPNQAKAINGFLHSLDLSNLSFSDWKLYLHILASTNRQDFIKNLVTLYPAIISLGEETAMRGVVDSIKEVCNQWK